MTYALFVLSIGTAMLGLGAVFIISSVRRYQHAETGSEAAKVDFVLVGVGAFCLGLLVFALGVFSVFGGGG